MKRFFALVLAAVMLAGLCACGKAADTDPEVYTENGVEIQREAFPENTVLRVEAVTQTAGEKINAVKAAVPAAQEVVAYELTATSDNVAVQPDGTVEVSFPIPAAYDSTKHEVRIYYVADDGTTEPVPCTVSGAAVVGTLSHFSTYVVVLVEKEAAGETTTSAAETTTTTTTKAPDTTQKATTTKATTTTTKEATVDVRGRVYRAVKLNGNKFEQCVVDFGKDSKTDLSIVWAAGETFDSWYAASGGAEAHPKEEVFKECADADLLVEYQGVYYYLGMGDGGGYVIRSSKPGYIEFSQEDGTHHGSISYTTKGNTLTITAIAGDTLLNLSVRVGDIFTLIE